MSAQDIRTYGNWRKPTSPGIGNLGLAASSRLHEAHDAYGRPFALLTVPATNHHTVVLTCNADGASLVDREQIDTWVAYWGQWLAALGMEPGLVSASVTVEAAPDTGE